MFIAWGGPYVAEVQACLDRSRGLKGIDAFLVTDSLTPAEMPGVTVKQVEFANEGFARKVELLEHLPSGYDSYLFLDSDTTVLDDISLGFDQAERHGLALAPAPHYSLDHFWGFAGIMRAEGVVPRGQLQFNTGVMFVSLTERTRTVLELWRDLAEKHWSTLQNDQPYLTLALEKLGVVPYVLSISYNYRAFGEPISGVVRVWHSHGALPEDLNEFEAAWPPRRAVPGRVLRAHGPLASAREYVSHRWRCFWRSIPRHGSARSIRGGRDDG